jgi:hypothetical protein
MTIQSALVAAIQEHRVIEFRDAGGYQRIGEPHLLGMCRETGSCQLEIFQTDGQTFGNRERLPRWRRFTLDDLWNLRTTGVEFEPRDDFNPHSPQWSHVMASVSASQEMRVVERSYAVEFPTPKTHATPESG